MKKRPSLPVRRGRGERGEGRWRGGGEGEGEGEEAGREEGAGERDGARPVVLLERHSGTEVGAQTAVGVAVDFCPRWTVLEHLQCEDSSSQRRGVGEGAPAPANADGH